MVVLLGVVSGLLAYDDSISPPLKSRAELQKLNSLIGGWRGTGQPRRGSNAGAWREDGEFVWEFQGSEPAVQYLVKQGKLMSRGRITWDAEEKQYRLTLTTPEDVSREYVGNWVEKALVFQSAPDSAGEVYQLTITPLNDKRTLVLHEKRKESGTTFMRLAEVGYTREGTRLAVAGSGGAECIVTGGLGTMTVSYQGKTYYVCCTGCKQAFEEDPAGIIAEAAARAQKEREKAASGNR
jgi:hypothetical protein